MPAASACRRGHANSSARIHGRETRAATVRLLVAAPARVRRDGLSRRRGLVAGARRTWTDSRCDARSLRSAGGIGAPRGKDLKGPFRRAPNERRQYSGNPVTRRASLTSPFAPFAPPWTAVRCRWSANTPQCSRRFRYCAPPYAKASMSSAARPRSFDR